MFGEQAAIRARFIGKRNSRPGGKPVCGKPRNQILRRNTTSLMHNIPVNA